MMRTEGSFDWHCRSLVDSAGFDGTRDRFVRSFGAGCEHRQDTWRTRPPCGTQPRAHGTELPRQGRTKGGANEEERKLTAALALAAK